ncbi:SWI5-dependent HO expression protein 4 [Vermiconidia calcicola]|uniref:SWI5-dependent HO expression protein 4 n=1 Tax=Vermiconidia calcicola TaxID=1690605 RepID=A0ACC3N9Y8_9PEZI|nr:SWI5-dependent HO expression protein 4 [Vermiconidia calcicola]
MPTNGTSDRIGDLIAKADEYIEANELQKASEALREASHLDSNNDVVKQRWTALQKSDGGADAVELLRKYLESQDAEEGQKALQALKAKQLQAKDAVQAGELLLDSRNAPELLDTLTGTLLQRNVAARKLVASRLSKNATQIFELLFDRGEESFNVVASVPLESSLWQTTDGQATAQRDVFRLSVATLIKAGAEHLERVMRCLARLLSLAPDTVAELVDEDVVDAVLSCLDIRLAPALRSQAMLATSKLLEATKERGEDLFSQFITGRAGKQTNDDLIMVFSAAAAVFPVISAVAARLFLIDGFVQQLVPNLERNSEDAAAGKRKSQTLETAALELLSAACVDKPCREAIDRYCSGWLEHLSEECGGTHKALAALVLAKISAESSEELTAKLEQLVLNEDPEAVQAIEGLAYTSLQAKTKEEIARNDKLIQQLVKSLKEHQNAMFGCLTVFANLTAYRPSMSEEQKKMSQLKAYANSEKPIPEDPLDNDAHVTDRCRRVLDADVVPALVACCRQSASPTSVALAVRVLLALGQHQKHRAKMAQQGAVKLLLQIRDRIANTDKATADAAAIGRNAAHALARLLISINPSHIFSSGLSASAAVSALVPLLSQDEDSEQRNLLPTFEALLALTNLASMEDNSIRDLQLRLVWSHLEDTLLFSPNVLVQRASVELVCNLMASPACVAKFVGDGSKREGTRMQILLALADVEDTATRRAAGGALAMLTEWDAAVTAILDYQAKTGPKGVKVLLALCADEAEDIKHRGFVCVSNVVNAPGNVGNKGTEKVKEQGGVEVLQGALKQTKSREVMTIGVEVLKKIM